MENVPELLRSAEYEAFKAAAEAEARLSRRGQSPQRRRLRRAAASAARDRDRRPRRRDPVARADALRPGRHIPPERRAVANVPRRGARSAAKADWQGLAHRPQPTAESIIRYQHVPHDGGNRFQMQESLDAAGLGHLVPRAGGTSPPERPTSSAASTGIGPRSRSGRSSTSRRRAATFTRARTGRSRSARRRAA